MRNRERSRDAQFYSQQHESSTCQDPNLSFASPQEGNPKFSRDSLQLFEIMKKGDQMAS